METTINKQLGFDPATVKRLTALEILKRIGPGIILAGVVVGPGAITTAAMLGSSYGYRMLWLFIPIFIMSITFMLTCYRLAMLTGMPLLHGIRHYYGKGAAAFVASACSFPACFSLLGTFPAAARHEPAFRHQLEDRIPDHDCHPAGHVFCQEYLFQSGKGNPAVHPGHDRRLLRHPVCSRGTGMGRFFRGVTHWGFPNGSIRHSLAFISTHAAITAGVYGTYLGAEKKWNKKDMFNGTMLADAIAHVVTVILISGAVVLVGAIVLHPQGLRIKSPVQLADMLRPFLGSYANLVMGLALLGAAFSSLLGNTQRGVVLLNAGLDKDVSLESRLVRWSCTACIVFGTVICFLYNGSPTQLIFIANLATAIGTPTAGFFVTRMIWRKDVNEG